MKLPRYYVWLIFVASLIVKLVVANDERAHLKTWELSYDGLLENVDGFGESGSLFQSFESSMEAISHEFAQLYDSYTMSIPDFSTRTQATKTRFDYDQSCRRQQHVPPFGIRCDIDVAATSNYLSSSGRKIIMTSRISSFIYHDQQDVRIQIDLNTRSQVADEMLTPTVLSLTVTKLNERFGLTESDPLWSIRERTKAQTNQPISPSAQQMESEKKAASIEQVILASKDLRRRVRIDSNFVSNQDTTVLGPGPQVWQYEQVGMAEPIRSLFDRHGRLVVSSGVPAHAHAEALVHPAMVAHVAPKRVAVLSETPVPLIREILKHKTVQHISVIGADPSLLALIQEYFPEWDDCSFLLLHTGSASCMAQPAVEIVEQDIQDWLRIMNEEFVYLDDNDYFEDKVEFDCDQRTAFYNPDCTFSKHPAFDIMLMDVTSNKESEWLDLNLQRSWHRLMRPESMSVVNAGSAYPLIDVPLEGEDDHTDNAKESTSPRDLLLRRASLALEKGGIVDDAMSFVYEEPLSRPFPSTYLITAKDNKWSYTRFFRRNTPGHDLDLIAKLHPNVVAASTTPGSERKRRQGRPTWVYDGPTHVSYLNVPLVWENWFCHAPQGRQSYMCKDFLPRWYDASYHHSGNTEVRRHPVKGRALYATSDIPKGHFVLAYDTALNLHMDGYQWLALEDFVENQFPDATLYKQLYDFYVVYGYEDEALGYAGWGVSIACNNTFVNHGCTEDQVNTGYIAEFHENEHGDFSPFSPVVSRRGELTTLVIATRNIAAGDEITEDYLFFREDDSAGLQKHVQFLNDMCREGVGYVAKDDGAEES